MFAGIDFGTTNSTAGFAAEGKGRMIALGDGDQRTTPTVLFYDGGYRSFAVGHQADDALRRGRSGRYMRSLKSYLGSTSTVSTRLGGREYSLEDLIAEILRDFRLKLEKEGQDDVAHLVLGRPVRFNEDDDALDQRAEDRLRLAAARAGFASVSFQYEPVAAALAYEATLSHEELIVVADIGGGTTDFSVIRVAPGKAGSDRSQDILSNHGIYTGGDDFDAALVRSFAAPEMGRGSLYRSLDKLLPIPERYYAYLSRWHLINALLERQTLSDLRSMTSTAAEPKKLGRLLELAESQLFFEFSALVEGTKKDLSAQSEAALALRLFADPVSIPVTQADFEDAVSPQVEGIFSALDHALRMAGVSSSGVDRVFLTGGTTLVRAVKAGFLARFSPQQVVQTDAFTSVGYGLVLEALARSR